MMQYRRLINVMHTGRPDGRSGSILTCCKRRSRSLWLPFSALFFPMSLKNSSNVFLSLLSPLSLHGFSSPSQICLQLLRPIQPMARSSAIIVTTSAPLNPVIHNKLIIEFLLYWFCVTTPGNVCTSIRPLHSYRTINFIVLFFPVTLH